MTIAQTPEWKPVPFTCRYRNEQSFLPAHKKSIMVINKYEPEWGTDPSNFLSAAFLDAFLTRVAQTCPGTAVVTLWRIERSNVEGSALGCINEKIPSGGYGFSFGGV